MSDKDNLSIEVPAPLDHWYGDTRLDSHNQGLLERNPHKARQLKTSSGIARLFGGYDEVKIAQSQLEKINQALESAQVDTLLDEYKHLKEEIEAYRVELFNLDRKHGRTNKEEKRAALIEKAKLIHKNVRGAKKDRQRLNKRLKPYRVLIVKRDKIKSRLAEHFAAIRDEIQEKKDVLDMDKEARLVAELIIVVLNRLGFYHRRTVKDIMGNTIIKKDHVRFARIICTPDKIHLKVDVSRLGLLGGHVDNLPHEVYAQDICTQKVLIELATALQRPVNSPNRTGDANWHKGIWYEIDRLGLMDGLQNMVSWSQVMRRYPEDKRHLMPVPMGVMKGRKINWIYLVKEPHLMVNGVTGYGKSNAMQMFISTLIMKHSPDDLRFIIVDMKNNGDFRWFEDLPHVIGTATDVQPALTLIQRTFKEMKRRQETIRKITNDIGRYNELVEDEADKLPHIFFIFDEYPAVRINKLLAKEIDLYASQIAMQGRAVGVHMFISGQQSYASDIPRLLSANTTFKFTARQATVSGAMATTGSMETMKMQNIKGRFLCMSEADNYQVQMPFIDIEEGDIDHALRDAMKWKEPRPFFLPAADETPDNIATMPRLTDEELILKTAFEKFGGQLKQRDIWDLNKKQLSQVRTKRAVDRILDNEIIEYEGLLYEAIKLKGGSYQLIEIDRNEAEQEIEIGA